MRLYKVVASTETPDKQAVLGRRPSSELGWVGQGEDTSWGKARKSGYVPSDITPEWRRRDSYTPRTPSKEGRAPSNTSLTDSGFDGSQTYFSPVKEITSPVTPPKQVRECVTLRATSDVVAQAFSRGLESTRDTLLGQKKFEGIRKAMSGLMNLAARGYTVKSPLTTPLISAEVNTLDVQKSFRSVAAHSKLLNDDQKEGVRSQLTTEIARLKDVHVLPEDFQLVF